MMWFLRMSALWACFWIGCQFAQNESGSRAAVGDLLPAGAQGRLGIARYTGDAFVAPVMFAGDGRMAVSIGSDAALYMWNARGGRLIRRIPLENRPQCLAILNDGENVACGWPDGSVRLIDVAGRSAKRLIGSCNSPVISIAISPDSKTLACGCDDGTVHQWNCGAPGHGHKLAGHEGGVTALAYSSDGSTLVSVGADKAARIWGTTSRKLTCSIKLAFPKADEKSGFSTMADMTADGQCLAVGTSTGDLVAWSVTTGRQLWQANVKEKIAAIHFSGNGDLLAVATSASLRLCHAKTGEQLPISQKWGTADAVCFMNEGSLLASASAHGFHVWDLQSGKDQLRQAGHEYGVDGVAFSPDGKMVASVSGWDETTRIWELATCKQTLILEAAPRPCLCYSVAFTPDGTGVVCAGGYNEIRVCDVRDGRIMNSLPALHRLEKNLRASSGDMTFSLRKDGKLLAVEAALDEKPDSRIDLWDVSAKKLLRSYQVKAFGESSFGISHEGRRMAFSPDGKNLAFASWSPVVNVRNWTENKDVLHLPTFKDSAVGCVAYSPDGRFLAASGGGWDHMGSFNDQIPVDNDLRIWDAQTGKLLAKPSGHTWRVSGIAWSPDSRVLVSAGRDGTLRLWEAASGLELFRLDAGSQFYCAAVSGDGKRIATGMQDGSILLWDSVPKNWATPTPAVLEPRQLERLKKDLACENGEEAYKAVWMLAQSPSLATSKVKTGLAMVSQENRTARILRCLSDLEADDFQKREAASAELAWFGGYAQAALKEALEKSKSAEVRQRAKVLLDVLERRKIRNVPAMFPFRAIWVLEIIGTPQAINVLEEFAAKNRDTAVAIDADRALQRLKTKQGSATGLQK